MKAASTRQGRASIIESPLCSVPPLVAWAVTLLPCERSSFSDDPCAGLKSFRRKNQLLSIASVELLILQRGAHPRHGVSGRLRYLLDQRGELDAGERIHVDAELLGLLQIGG